ncbi:MAG: putative rane protein [Actinomycetota bacterium]|nr:putative rane protein [Actinomycetota bacterium]
MDPLTAAAVPFPAWHAHVDSWALFSLILFGYWLALRRERARRGPAGAPVATRRQLFAFGLGVALMWVVSDWPVHDLAEGYLYSVHMAQHLTLTLVVAPLLLVGTPGWLARRLLSPPGLLKVVRALTRPAPALFQANLVLVLSHWPAVVEMTLLHHPLHFVAHAVLLTSAVLMWFPVLSPLPEVPRLKPPVQMLYLFLQTVVPTVPASFLTFGKKPLYPIYETFPRLWHISALNDQLFAGLIMKVGAGFYLWIVIAVIFFRWYAREEATQTEFGEPAPVVARGRGAGGEPDVLLWHDVEQELARLGPAPAAEPQPPPP